MSIGDFGLDHVNRIVWLLLVAACAMLMIYGFYRKNRAMRDFVDAGLFGSLAPDVSRGRQVLKAILLLVSMTILVGALLGPKWGKYFAEVHKKELDVVICLDVSRSMLAEDAGMSRLDRAKDDIKRLLNEMSGGMVGLVAFGGRARLVCPLTDDYEFFKLALNDVDVNSAPLGGTDIGAAIAEARHAFDSAGRRYQVIMLVSDGEDHVGNGAKEAEKARADGMTVYAVGVGDAERGGLIPVYSEGGKSYLVHNGQQVWSKLDSATLDAVARAGGGEYHPSAQVTGSERTLEWIYKERIEPHLHVTDDERKAVQLYPRFHWLAWAALGLLVIESAVSERRGRKSGARMKE